MKILLKKRLLIDWEEIDVEKTKEKCDEYFSKDSYDYEARDLVLENLCVGKNGRGQIIIGFDSKNHKYFEIDQYPSWNSWDDVVVEGEESCGFGSRDIGIKSSTKVWEKNGDWAQPIWMSSLVVVPENEEEDNLIDGYIFALPLKYEYSIIFIPMDDYFMELKERDRYIVEPEKIYRLED